MLTIKKIFRSTIIPSITLVPTLVFGWNYSGHVIVAQIAYDQLPTDKRIIANDLAAYIYQQLPIKEQNKLNKQFNSASTFAKVAALPDTWRKWKLSTLFMQFNALPTINLFFDLKENSASYHFIDTPYPNNKSCFLADGHDVIWAINNLENGMKKSHFKSTQALEMVLLEHYIGDIHQPLHTLTNISTSCQGDRGGNNFCLSGNPAHCTKNLHSLWDSGVGYIKPHSNIAEIAYKIERLYPLSTFKDKTNENDPKQWANESYQLASFIYQTKPDEKPSITYYQNGQAIATSQLALAGYRLSMIMNESL